ncbi:MAG: cyclodeaminase/cyclohydrolase family protein [Dehalobacterium sp.]
MLIDLSCDKFMEELASDSPAPGGGSVSALAGSMSAALVAMVASLTKGKENYWTDQKELEDVLAEATNSKNQLLNCVDRDTEAFNRVMSAFKLPKSNDEEKLVRTQAIQSGLKAAIAVPLEVAESCIKVLRFTKILVYKGNPNALSDSAVAALMSYAGIQGAIFNIKINLNSVKDQSLISVIKEREEDICREAELIINEVIAVVRNKLD